MLDFGEKPYLQACKDRGREVDFKSLPKKEAK
jgi:hypothetical protein